LTLRRIKVQKRSPCTSNCDNVASACSVYYWPQENRLKDDNGKIGILHVKCAVADGERLFLSSANLTQQAFTINDTQNLVYKDYRDEYFKYRDLHGNEFSVFYKDEAGAVFHTYSAYARGLDSLVGTYRFLDLAPKGRDEDGLAFTMSWVRHHDKYGDDSVLDAALKYTSLRGDR
jgi:phosphatidylserine/phosphatidylglycerophosphate/cardiolipin synthase-like enzyme